MMVIGITGGTGCGKSTVTSYLKEKGYSVLDADEISHEIADSDLTRKEIRDSFGDDVFDDDGVLDRKKLGGIVFGDPGKRRILEDIITRRVVSHVKNEISLYRSGVKYVGGKVLFLDAPILFEAGADSLCDSVWLVTCDDAVRMERLKARDDLSQEDLKKRISSQMPEEEKAAKSDVLLDNSGSIDELHERIDELIINY